MSLGSRKRCTAIVALCVSAGMVGAAYAAVPLYKIFCQVTGYGGTTQVAEIAPARVLARTMTIRFNTDVDKSLPWRFEPVQAKMVIRVGEQGLAFFRAKNMSSHAITGTAAFNVTPDKAGIYFNKIQCFCFTEQRLEPGAEIDMPVTFFVDPKIAEDRDTDDVTTITLSYTFFQTEADTDRSPRAATASPKTNG